ncbi:hypothetical protein FHT44_002851 [Mycolicibacterium sp. BK634]|uniref:hypothetical protein n=1 Tax=Mycolicibacterium sp. BK634 TaxID=2587099 RepID=UPI00161F9776|nr:hypothetical protein [Mycolicibacterium sp. BK634]MBB3750390.1 hypothetical protein [Mycolicibacterium sp. BK634]
MNTPGGGALIEQIILVVKQELRLLENELNDLAAELGRSLLASIDRASASIVQSPTPTNHHTLGEP